MTDELAQWLLEQIADDERGPNFCHCGNIATPEGYCRLQPGCPKRIALECEAKRRIIKMYTNALACKNMGSASSRNSLVDEAAEEVLGEAVRELGLIYAEYPGYREEWRP